MLLIVLFWIVNVATFVAAQWLIATDFGGRLSIIRDGPKDGTMNYLVAGMLNQPQGAYDFLLDRLKSIILVEYSQRGWSPDTMAQMIYDDIKEQGYRKVRIFTTSVGDKVARYLEYWVDDAKVRLEVVAINPCPVPQILKPFYRKLAEILGPLLYMICIILGWLSCIPIIPATHGLYSLMLLTDQLYQAGDESLPTITRRTVGVVMSTRDRFLDNDVMQAFYERPQYAWVEAGHADVERSGQAYLRAIAEVLRKRRSVQPR